MTMVDIRRAANQAVASGWTPADLTNLYMWLKPSALSGYSDGAYATSWADASGNGNDATNSAGSTCPVCKTSILNGYPIVRFDNTFTQYLAFSRCSYTRYVAMVCKRSGYADYAPFLMGDTGYYHFHADTGGKILLVSSNAFVKNGTIRIDGSAVAYNYAWTDTDWHILTMQMAGTITGTDVVAANQLTRDRTFARSWYGDIAEVLIVDTDLITSQENANVESAWASKYGISIS